MGHLSHLCHDSPGVVRTRKQKALPETTSFLLPVSSPPFVLAPLLDCNPSHSNEGNPNNENQPGSDGPTLQFSGTLVDTFVELTSSSPEEALFFLESQNFDLDAAVSIFFVYAVTVAHLNPNPSPNQDLEPHPSPPFPISPPSQSRSQSHSQSYSPSSSRSRWLSPSPARPAARAPHQLRSRWSSEKKGEKKGSSSRSGGVRTLADMNEDADVDGSDEPDEGKDYYTGGEKSGMLVRDPRRGNDVDSILDRARQAGAFERTADERSSRSKSFMGKARLLLGEAVKSAPQPPESVNHTVRKSVHKSYLN